MTNDAHKITIYIPSTDLNTKERLEETAKENDHTISKQIYLLIRDYFREEPDASERSSQY